MTRQEFIDKWPIAEAECEIFERDLDSLLQEEAVRFGERIRLKGWEYKTTLKLYQEWKEETK
jgi:hypothetical protein